MKISEAIKQLKAILEKEVLLNDYIEFVDYIIKQIEEEKWKLEEKKKIY